MIISIILAAGKGTRFKSKDQNKTVVSIGGKPLVSRAVDLVQNLSQKIVVVVGFANDSVKQALNDRKGIIYALQTRRLGTGHALLKGFEAIKNESEKPEIILVGYADHMFLYEPSQISQMIKFHRNNKAKITLVATSFENPDELAWGRIITNESGEVQKIVEQKDASVNERKIKNLNAGYYCFDADFLRSNVAKIKKSPVTGEYYLTELIGMATQQKLPVLAFELPFSSVGYGVNTREQLEMNEQLMKEK